MINFIVKKIVKKSFIFTMIFFLGSNANAMHTNNIEKNYKEDSPYCVLDPLTQSSIDILYNSINQVYGKKSSFKKILNQLTLFLSQYENNQNKSTKALVSRVIGIARLKNQNGYVVNNSLLSHFTGFSKSRIRSEFDRINYIMNNSTSVEENLKKSLEYLMPNEKSSWIVRLFEPPANNTPEQNTQISLINNSILSFPLADTPDPFASLNPFINNNSQQNTLSLSFSIPNSEEEIDIFSNN